MRVFWFFEIIIICCRLHQGVCFGFIKLTVLWCQPLGILLFTWNQEIPTTPGVFLFSYFPTLMLRYNHPSIVISFKKALSRIELKIKYVVGEKHPCRLNITMYSKESGPPPFSNPFLYKSKTNKKQRMNICYHCCFCRRIYEDYHENGFNQICFILYIDIHPKQSKKGRHFVCHDNEEKKLEIKQNF